jgi:hypothetical protein
MVDDAHGVGLAVADADVDGMLDHAGRYLRDCRVVRARRA